MLVAWSACTHPSCSYIMCVPATVAAAPGTGEAMPGCSGEGGLLCVPADLEGPSGVRLISVPAAGKGGIAIGATREPASGLWGKPGEVKMGLR